MLNPRAAHHARRDNPLRSNAPPASPKPPASIPVTSRTSFDLAREVAAQQRRRQGVVTGRLPTKGNLQGLIGDLLGDKVVTALARDNALDLGGLTMRLVTRRVPLQHRGPVLGAWTTIDHFKEIARSRFATAIVFLPWLDEELDEFRGSFPEAMPLG
jgi:hypothetical protein